MEVSEELKVLKDFFSDFWITDFVVCFRRTKSIERELIKLDLRYIGGKSFRRTKSIERKCSGESRSIHTSFVSEELKVLKDYWAKYLC